MCVLDSTGVSCFCPAKCFTVVFTGAALQSFPLQMAERLLRAQPYSLPITLQHAQWCQDTSDPGHFGPKTFRHYQTGAEVSFGHFGASAEVFGTAAELSRPR